MNPFKISMWLAGGAFVAWTHFTAYRFGGDAVKMEVLAQSLKSIEQARAQTQEWADKATKAQNEYQHATHQNQLLDRRIRSLNDRMRNQSPSAERLAQLTSAALGDYAAEVERDFAECRAEIADLGSTAASASAAAWALNDAWPD
jgi:chromosome segregation ATPase